ncbi:MAG: ATP-binding cassette domain-containing protein [Candidatus Kerfeldbacteria bacterium]|nr:ATP-binding cassette domain-containing protein [Candidatus Kerfeldbacteria bacterium]
MSSVITVEQLSRSFRLKGRNSRTITAVDHISFQVQQGELFGFLGPNGAGKSTTIAMLTTLLLPSSGTATVAGFDIQQQRDQVRKKIGIIFQETTLDHKLTAYENLNFHGVLYGINRITRRQRITELLAMVELSDRAHSIVQEFSGGMKRRLEIARGLLHLPEILFLDEPTLGLDPQTREHIWRYIDKIRQTRSMTIFLTTHYLDEVENCNRVAIIDGGKIIALDQPSTLKTRYQVNTMNQVFLEATGHGIREDELL